MSKKRPNKRLLVTGGAGFIGSAFIRRVLARDESPDLIVNYDCLSYAANLESLKTLEQDERYLFVAGDIANGPVLEALIRTHKIDTIVHFAAESHVDRSIKDPVLTAQTNIMGTLSLLEVVRRFPNLHFHHVSTDEVYGSLGEESATEQTAYAPNSPYSAAKAAADHLVRAYAKTYGISMTMSHGSNTYGPYQNEEKFLPQMTMRCLRGEMLPIYGKGVNERDWLFVDDHADAIWTILTKAPSGERYNVAGGNVLKNLDILEKLFHAISHQTGDAIESFRALIAFVDDRPGHDLRYCLNGSKIQDELKWAPKVILSEGLSRLVAWYISREELAPV